MGINQLKRMLVLVNFIIPVLVGGLIYIFYRPYSLIMFRWLEFLGLSNFFVTVRSNERFLNTAPEWFIYSLPNGLWVYSFTFFMVWFWYNAGSKQRNFWMIVGPLIGVGSEFGQLFKVIPGTFDIIDLLFYLGSSFLSFLWAKKLKGDLLNEL